MKDDTLRDFLQKLGDKSPTPGGGAVSALNGAIAAAQLRMVCEYTKDQDMKDKADFLSRSTENFLNLAEADSEVFKSVSEAYKSKDAGRLNSSLINAINVSSRVIEACEEVVSLCEDSYSDFNPKLQADTVTSLANLRAAVSSAQAMEKTNIDAYEGNLPQGIHKAVTRADDNLKRIDILTQKIKKEDE